MNSINSAKKLLVIILIISIYQAVDYNEEYIAFDYTDNGDNWTSDRMKTCTTSLRSAPVDLGSKTLPAKSDLSVIAYPLPSKATVTFYNTTVRVRSDNATHGFGIVYLNTAANGAQPFRLHSLKFRAPAAHTFEGGNRTYNLEMQIYGYSIFYP